MTKLAFFAALAAAAFGAVPAPADDNVDYQKVAEAASWEWRPERVNLLSSVMNAPKEYTVEVVRPKNTFGDLTIRFLLDDKTVYTWDGNAYSPFVFDGTVLYYPQYNTGSNGCTLIAYDLKTQKQLWKTDLQGLGPIAHFRYHNEVTVEGVPGAILVHGNESSGKYIEYVDVKTGKTVGHKVFKDN